MCDKIAQYDDGGAAERIEELASELVGLGVPAAFAIHVADGLISILHRFCWANMTDVIGTVGDVDSVTCWRGSPASLAPAMENAGVLVKVRNIYVMPTAVRYCPEWARKRWRRNSMDTYDRAMERSRRAGVNRSPKPTAGGLFGQPVSTQSSNEPGYQQIVGYWFEKWEQKYGRKYIFTAKDGANIKRLLKSTDADDLTDAIDRYLACTEPFFAGHQIGQFVSQINRWLTVGEAAGQQERDLEYRRTDRPPAAKDRAAK